MEGKAQARVGGYFDCVIKDKKGNVRDEFRVHNLVVNEGLDYLLNAGLYAGSTAQITAWYVGILGNRTPAATDTMSDIGSDDVVGYDEATRPQYTPNGATSSQSVSNSSSPATFTCSSDSTSFYGLFVCSSSSKTDTSSTLLAAAAFPSTKVLDEGEELLATYNFGAADADGS